MRSSPTLLAIAILCAAPCRTAQTPPADLVLLDGRIVTLEAPGIVAGLAAKSGRIVALGSNEEVRKHIGETTRVLDLDGKTAVPGFVEGHAHFVGLGASKLMLDLTKARTWDDVIAMVAEATRSTPKGEWIVGRGWHQEKWSRRPEGHVEGFPTHHSLSAVSPDHPVALTHASGHAAFFNRNAMDLAGISKTTRNPTGGEILKDPSGEPIGVFRETAAGLVDRARTRSLVRRTKEQRRADLRRKIRLASEECLRKGVTSFQDAGSSFGEIRAFREAAEQGQLGVRLWVMVRAPNIMLASNLREQRVIGAYDHHLTVRAIKRSIDGALGSRGAWLLEPYSDSEESTGLATSTVESVTETARIAKLHGFQLCVHAIGDRANREVLDIFEKAFGAAGGKDLRWRIEHAQHIHEDDIPRFGKLSVIASMQGVHCTSDAPYVIPRLGVERARTGAYAWQSLMKSGAVVTNGTDAPVEDVDPIASFHATVTRQPAKGEPFFPEQRMTRMEALRSYTIQAAFAAFEEQEKGSLKVGKLADVVVLSQDILKVEDGKLLDTEVVWTVVGGKVRYSAR